MQVAPSDCRAWLARVVGNGTDNAARSFRKRETRTGMRNSEQLFLTPSLPHSHPPRRCLERLMTTVAYTFRTTYAAASLPGTVGAKNLMSTEMENFQGLQAEEKKVFLANLESMEQSIKDKEREAEEVRATGRCLIFIQAFTDDHC